MSNRPKRLVHHETEIQLSGARVGSGWGRSWWCDDALLRVPVLSTPHAVADPSEELNSWAEYSAVWPVIEPDQVTVMVAAPAVVTLPYQISSSAPASRQSRQPSSTWSPHPRDRRDRPRGGRDQGTDGQEVPVV